MSERLYFPLKRTTSGDADRVVDDPIGNFSCLLVTAKFLDIENLAKPFLKSKTVKPTKVRTLNRADGSTVNRSSKNTSGVAAEHERPGRLSRGTRRVVLTTGKKIDARVGAKANYHTISFRFPGFATILVIADALGTIIPANKMKANPTATDVSPYFKVAGGGRYPIMQKAAAESRQDAVVPLTAQQIAALTGDGISFIPGAGV
ncbi:MAG: hypothetical protein V7K41_29910 [Nostoc sp.]|uniref:hypothetical protein n=1 Tax=Nostoc sp. TaxID=1180 RepID=UPI002FFA65CD